MLKTIFEPILDRMKDQFKAFIESIDAKFDAQKESRNSQLGNLRWVVRIGIGVLIAAGESNTLANLFGWRSG